MVPLVFFAASCFVGGKKIHVRKRQEATLTSLPTNELGFNPNISLLDLLIFL